jgi:hypothetical protein
LKNSPATLVLSLLLVAGFVWPATAQTRATAMTCDYYKKQVSLAITKTRRADADARAELQKQEQEAAQNGQQEETLLVGERPPGPPERDYAAVENFRRAGDMACAQRKFEQGVNEYNKALNLLGVDLQRR